MEADAAANAYREDQLLVHRSHVQQSVWGEPWAIWIGDRKLTHHYKEKLTEWTSGRPFLAHLDKKQTFGTATSEKQDWSIVATMMKTKSQGSRRETTKHITGNFGHRKNMYRWKEVSDDLCPICKNEVEDHKHILQCQDARSLAAWDTAMAKCRETLIDLQTDPAITECLMEEIDAWRKQREPNRTSEVPRISAMRAEQEASGWYAFMHGFPVKGWGFLQQRHIEENALKSDGRRWLLALLRKLQDVAWDQWTFRNGLLHDKESGEAAMDRRNQITNAFEIGRNGVLAKDRRALFKFNLEQVLTLNQAQQHMWLTRWKSAREVFTHRQDNEQQQLAGSQLLMHQWLSGATNQNTDTN